MLEPITDPVALRHATLDAIRANPEHWEQAAWRCDTGMCFAGWTAVLAGGTFPYAESDHRDSDEYEDVCRRNLVTAPDGTVEVISEFAQAVLQLTTAQANALFDAENDLGDLEKLVRLLDTGEPIEDYRNAVAVSGDPR